MTWTPNPAFGSPVPGAGNRWLTSFGALMDWTGTSGTDDSGAWASAIAWAQANYPASLLVPDGVSYCGSVWPVIEKPVSIIAPGKQTFVWFGVGAVGQCITLRNVGYDNIAGYMDPAANVAFSNKSVLEAGVALEGFTICGDRSVSQHGLVLEGNCDFLSLDLGIMYFAGRGLWSGKAYGGVRGYTREATKIRIRTRNCGKSDGTESILFELPDSPSNVNADSSNLVECLDLQVVYPYGRGLAFIDSRTTGATSPPIYRFRGRALLHGPYPSIFSAGGALLHVEGGVNQLDLDVTIAYSRYASADILFKANSSIGTKPNDCRLRIQQGASLKGADVQDGVNIDLDWVSIACIKEALTIGSSMSGPLSIRSQGESPYCKLPSAITLNGLNPVSVPFVWATTPGLQAFFPVLATNGTGDSMKVAALGLTGTLTRSGSTTSGTDTYTFTPDLTSTVTISAGNWFTKFVVKDADIGKVFGRYDHSHASNSGIRASGFWASDRLIELGPWRLWFDTANNLRIGNGPPASETAGWPLSTWKDTNVTSGTSFNVAGFSHLNLVYGSSTTLSNLTGGVTGQTVTLLAVNANATIAHGTGAGAIRLTGGANLALASGQLLRLTFSSYTGLWYQAA